MKLSTKIAILLVCAVWITGIIVGNLTLEATNRSFSELTDNLWEYTLNRWSDYFTQYYEKNDNSWDGVNTFYKALLNQTSPTANIGDNNVVLVDGDGTILVHSDEQMLGGQLNRSLLNQGKKLYSSDNTLIGILFPGTYFSSKFWSLQQHFNESMVAATIKGICLTSLFAMMLALALSRSIVLPLKEFIAATGKMAKTGNLEEQLPIYSEDELGELARAFNTMAEELDNSVTIRRQMFADISHELKTPLTVLATKLESALERNKPLDSVEIAVLYDEVIRLKSMVSELQDLSKLEVGQISLEKTMIDFKAFFSEFLMLVQAEAQDRGITLVVDLQDTTPYCYADPYRLKQIVLNLVNNALRYTPDGGIVKISTYGEDNWFVFRVEDNGIGISQEDLPYIFQRFYRADRSRNNAPGGGSGLGLAITDGFVKAHGGTITVDSVYGQGSTFTVKLPTYREEENQ